MGFSEILLIAIAVLFSFWIAAQLLKKYAKAEVVYGVVSLLRTKKFNAAADSLAKNKWLERLATLGVILGFGVIAVDFYFARKQKPLKRAAIWIVSILLLSAFFLIEPFGAMILESGNFSKALVAIMTLSFALFGFAGFSLVLLAYSAIDIISKVLAGTTPCPGIAPIVPGVQFPNVPKEITPPIYIWLTFFILLFIHEFSHGIMMRRAKVTIKSFGLLLLGYLPFGAFAEPDEEQLKKTKPEIALKVYAAGPAANLYSMPIFFVIMLLYVLLIFNPFILPASKNFEAKMFNAVVVGDVNSQYSFCGTNYANPAFGTLEKGMVIKQINGVQVKFPSDLAKARLFGDVNFLVEKNSELLEKRFAIGDKNALGLRAMQFDYNRNSGFKPTALYSFAATANNLFDSFMSWLMLLSIAIASANFIPMMPFDGGRMVKILLAPYLNVLKMNRAETEKLVGRVFFIITISLIILNALPLFLF